MYGYGNSMFLATHGILARTNAAVLPVNTVAPAITGTAQEGQTLTCSTGTWTGTPIITYTYQWKRNGSNIGSATNSTYTLVTADVGQSIKCTVTATNGAGSVNADSNTVTPTAALLLDTYSGASAAYSLRKLRTAYSGSAIRVRRSSDNAEQNIAFVNNVLDTASLLTFCGAGSGFVTTWYDQSGNANNFTSNTAVNQPQIVSLGVVTASSNGLPSVNFGGSTSTYFLNSPTNFLNNTATPISMFNTWRVIDYTNSNSGVFAPSTTNSLGLEILQTSIISRRSLLRLNNVLKNDNSGAAYQLWNDNTSTNTSLILTSSSTAAYKNGSAVTLTNSTGIANLSSGVTSYSMGRYATTNYMAGDIQEIVFYNLDQSSNRVGIESNINAYYGIY